MIKESKQYSINDKASSNQAYKLAYFKTYYVPIYSL